MAEKSQNPPETEIGVVVEGGRLLPFGEAAIEAVLDCFVGELPQTARMLNCGAVVTEVVFGKGITPGEDEQPQEYVWTYFEGLLEGLVMKGVLQTHEDDEWKQEDEDGAETNIVVYSLSRESLMIYHAVRRAPLITTVPELVDSYNDGTLCRAAADTIAHLVENRG